MARTIYLILFLLTVLKPIQDYGQGNNLFKFNVSPLLLKSYVVQYERVITKKHSLALTFGYMPRASLPFSSLLLNRYGTNEDAKSAIENAVFKKYNLTLEYRFYVGKKSSPKGLYLAPFARFVSMNLHEQYPFTPGDGTQHRATVSSNFHGVGAGLLLGYQWLFSKHAGVDFWIAGPFYGPDLKATWHGYDPEGNLSPSDQAELEKQIENGNIPGYTIDATVSQNTAGPTTVDVKMKGPYYGIRALGLCFVYRF